MSILSNSLFTTIKGVLVEYTKAKPNDVDALIQMARKVQSIAAQARKAIILYPVITSSSVQDIDVLSKMRKFIEIQYATFTVLALGVSYDRTQTSTSERLSVVSAESIDNVNYELAQSIESAMTPYRFKEKSEIRPRIGKNAIISTEATGATGIDMHMEIPSIDEMRKKDKMLKLKETVDVSHFANSLDRLNRDALPTIINLRFNTATTIERYERKDSKGKGKQEEEIKYKPVIDKNDEGVNIPIAIKANLSAIGQDELRALLESGIEKALPSLRYVKAKTGEISIIKDLLLEMDKAERDKMLYNKLGRNPWMRKLLDRKMFSRMNFALKKMDEKSILPTSTLILTKDDLVLSTKLDFSHFLNDNKLIRQIMEKMFLLSIAIYESEIEQITFFYNGFNEPFIYSMKEIAKSGKEPQESLFETLANLSRKIG